MYLEALYTDSTVLPWVVVAGVFGLVIGSFLNVLGLRLLREEDFVKKPSYCYHCEHRLNGLDMIPVLSYLVFKAQCRYCKGALTWQYPAVELLTGLLFALTVGQFGVTLQAALLMWLMANLVVILITDFREQYIFDINSIGLIPFGLAYCAVVGWSSGKGLDGVWPLLVQGALAVAFSWLSFALLNVMSRLIFKADGFGEGDTRLLIGLGSYFGLYPIVAIFIVSFILQIALTIPMMLWKWLSMKQYKVIGLFVLAFVLGFVPYGVQQIAELPSWAVITAALVCAVGALFTAFKALALAREATDELTYVPFGPAICVAAALYVYLVIPLSFSIAP